MINQDNINKRVLLLALYKKHDNESFNDIVLILSDNGLFSQKDGKKLLKELRDEEYIKDGNLTLKALAEAQIIENDFKL